MIKTKKSSKGLGFVLAAALALVFMAGFPPAALATGDVSALIAPDVAVAALVDEGSVVIDEKSFPDENFRSYVTQELDPNYDGVLQRDELLLVTRVLPARYYPIATLKGIEFFPNLTALYFAGFKLTTLDLTRNPELRELRCYNTNLTTLDLTQNTKLTELKCSGNRLTTLKLPATDTLTSLDCIHNQITSLDLTQNTGLTQLSCEANALTTLDLSKNTLLENAWFAHNDLTSLCLPESTTLTSLDCTDNELRTLDLSKTPAITALGCRDNQLLALDLSGLNLASYENNSAISPQRHAAPITLVKRSRYKCEMDMSTVSDGKGVANLQIGAAIYNGMVDKVTIEFVPLDLSYTYDTKASNEKAKTITVKADNFAVYQAVTANVGDNGTISWEGKLPVNNEFLMPDGSTPSFAITPNSGYKVDTLKVDGEDAKGNLVGEILALPAVTATVSIDVTFTKKSVDPVDPPKPPVDPVDPPTPPVDPVDPPTPPVDPVDPPTPPVDPVDPPTPPVDPPTPPVGPTDPVDPIDPPTPPVDPTDPVDPPKPPVDPTDPPKPPVDPTDPADPTDPVDPPIPPVVPDNGGNNNNGGGGTTIVERTNTVELPAAPAAAATPAVTTEAPAKVTAEPATPQGQLENPTLGAKSLDLQHSHIPLILLLLAVWLVGGFTVDRQRKRTRDAIEGASY